MSNEIEGSRNDRLRPLVMGLVGSNFFALFVGSIYEYLSLRGIVNMLAAWFVLIFAWVIGVAGVVLSEIVWGRKNQHRLLIGCGAALGLAILLILLHLVANLIVAADATPVPTAPPPLDYTVQFDCSPGMYPKTLPANGAIDLQFSGTADSPAWGFGISTGIVEFSSRSNLVLACTLANRGPTPISNVTGDLTVKYEMVIKNKNGTQSGDVLNTVIAHTPRVDLLPNSTEKKLIYIINRSAFWLSIKIPDLIKVETLGSGQWQEVKLIPGQIGEFGLPPYNFEPPMPNVVKPK